MSITISSRDVALEITAPPQNFRLMELQDFTESSRVDEEWLEDQADVAETLAEYKRHGIEGFIRHRDPAR